MDKLLWAIGPEALLCVVACVLFLLGTRRSTASRRAAPVIALTALGVVALFQVMVLAERYADGYGGSVVVDPMAQWVKLVTAGAGALFVLLAWPTNADGTGNASTAFGTETGEFFGLMLLSLAGLMLVGGANDLILLFMGIELAAIPTYILVSISRPLPVAQEAGVKYFFLGAMSAAVLLMGFAYLYGTTGSIYLGGGPGAVASIADAVRAGGGGVGQPAVLSSWQLLAVVLVIGAICFKMAAVPLHYYAGDVYQGAATPVTAMLSYVPKASGLVALLKVLIATSGVSLIPAAEVRELLLVLAIATMTVGNVLGLLQFNIKRVMAYSSVAHSGYLLAGVAALAASGSDSLAAGGGASLQQGALGGLMFYLAAYALMNVAVFGVLQLIPSRGNDAATSAETFDDIAGQGRRRPLLGVAMAVACLSLAGIPFTVGFWGKLMLVSPALGPDRAHPAAMTTLAMALMLNSAVSLAYYLKIPAAMFFRASPGTAGGSGMPTAAERAARSMPAGLAVALSAGGAILLGVGLPLTTEVADAAQAAGAVPVITVATTQRAE